VLWLFHSLLLASDGGIDDIFAAFGKVTAGHGQLV
jgi:hypothetical protein